MNGNGAEAGAVVGGGKHEKWTVPDAWRRLTKFQKWAITLITGMWLNLMVAIAVPHTPIMRLIQRFILFITQ